MKITTNRVLHQVCSTLKTNWLRCIRGIWMMTGESVLLSK
jgi:hypothetical protein